MEEEVKTFSEMADHRLKTVSIETLEQTIAKAVSELVGVELTCRIDSLTFDNRVTGNGATFNASLRKPMKWPVKNRV